MWGYWLVLAAVTAAPMTAYASCIENAEAKIQSYDVGDIFSEFRDEAGKEVVIYKRKEVRDFLVVEEDEICITSMKLVDKNELSLKYGIEDEAECEECAGIAEGGEDVAQSADAEETTTENAEGMTQYDNINVAALLELYQVYDGILACYKARENQFPVYLTKAEMEKADVALKKDEAEILRRDPRIDKKAIAKLSVEGNMLFASVIMTNGLIKMNYEHRSACRRLAQLFPPGIDNAQLVEREVIGKKNTGGGLIVPIDPRFQ